MKRVVMSFAAIAVVSTVVSAGPGFEITPMVGKKIYNDDKPYFDDSEVLFGARANVYVTENISAQAGFEASTDNGIRTDLNDPSIPGNTDLQRYSLSAQYDIPTATKVTPYLFAGGGYEKIAHEYEDIESQPFIDAGGGLKYAINDTVDIVTEVRAIHKTKDKDDDITAGVGVGFKFGGGSSSYSPPAQSQPKAMSMRELAQLAKANEARNSEVRVLAPTIVSSVPIQTEVQIPMARTYPLDTNGGVSSVSDSSMVVVDSGISPVYDEPMATTYPVAIDDSAVNFTSEEVSSEIVYDRDDSVNICDVMGGGSPYVDADYLDSEVSSTFVDDIPSDVVPSSSLSGYFVQVAALSKNSPNRLVSKLKAKNYPVVLKKSRGVTKVLVGPYSKRSAASKSLVQIKRIQGDAFIYRKR